MADVVILYPSPAIGHLISMVEFGKLLLTHKPSLSIHILTFTPPYSAGSTDKYISTVGSTVPSITFHHLPTVILPPSITAANHHHETLTFEVLRLNKTHVHEVLLSIICSDPNSKVNAFIMDFFCLETISVAEEVKIPPFVFYTSGAAVLASFLYLPTVHESTTESFKEMKNTFLNIPGVPPVLATDMVKPILDRRDKAYGFFLEISINLPKSSGIIVNTFEELEPRALKAVTDGLCVPNGPTPPVYCVGPLTSARDGDGDGVNECLTWLDSKPSKSVVFLCFGSLGLFSKQQLHEIAIGLEKTHNFFLWVVRNPPPPNQTLATTKLPDPDLDSLLPDGFLSRTKDRGFVVKSWAPQTAVLSHDSVGGFFTHCGWNSVLESVCAGVPMVAWPLYAEQRFNRVVMVEELKIALTIEEDEDGFVSSSEVEKRVRELMDSDSVNGELVRKKTMAMKEAGMVGLSQGESSRVALAKLVDSWSAKSEFS